MTVPQTKKTIADATASGEPLSQCQHPTMRVDRCHPYVSILCDRSLAYAVLLQRCLPDNLQYMQVFNYRTILLRSSNPSPDAFLRCNGHAALRRLVIYCPV